MKKKLIFILAAGMCLVTALSSCGKEKINLSLDIAEDGRSAEITADKTGTDDLVMSGTLSVGEHDVMKVSQKFEGDGSLTAQFIPSDDVDLDKDSEAEDIKEAAGKGESKLDIVMEGTGKAEYYLPEGEYYIRLKADTKTTGTASIILEEGTEDDAFGDWGVAESAEEAAEKAGVEWFTVPDGVYTSLGTTSVEAYRYKEGTVMADIPVGAVQIYVLKGLKQEDVFDDGTKYKHKWTENVNGYEVTCRGNREGEATKTTWKSGDYSYAILAYGAGGDDDYGLSYNDMVNLFMYTK